MASVLFSTVIRASLSLSYQGVRSLRKTMLGLLVRRSLYDSEALLFERRHPRLSSITQHYD